MQYLYYRYCIELRQARWRSFRFSRQEFLAHHQNRGRSGALFTPCVDTLGSSRYGQDVPRRPIGG